jgi:hypothetical protein
MAVHVILRTCAGTSNNSLYSDLKGVEMHTTLLPENTLNSGSMGDLIIRSPYGYECLRYCTSRLCLSNSYYYWAGDHVSNRAPCTRIVQVILSDKRLEVTDGAEGFKEHRMGHIWFPQTDEDTR